MTKIRKKIILIDSGRARFRDFLYRLRAANTIPYAAFADSDLYDLVIVGFQQSGYKILSKNSSDSISETVGLSYRDAGVDIDAGNDLVERIKPAVKNTHRKGVAGHLGGFGAIFDLKAEGWVDPLLVSGTDGVGTKLMLARQLDSHETIGIDLVAMCVNDILTNGAEPLFFLDYFASGKLEIDQAQAVIEGIAEGCKLAGCALIGGETAEMPGMYGQGEYDLAGFAVGAVEREKLIDGSRIESGHRLIGLASSGPHSNGYSLIRKVIDHSGADVKAIFEGEENGRSLGQALLEPTRIYVSALLPLLNSRQVDGLAHITGGGLSENIIRVLDASLGIQINTASWTLPPIFSWLQQAGKISDEEMRRTFNCGIGMVVLVHPDHSGSVMEQLRSAGTECFDIGEVISPIDSNRVIFT